MDVAVPVGADKMRSRNNISHVPRQDADGDR